MGEKPVCRSKSLLSTIIVRDKVVYFYRPIGFLTVNIYEPISDRLDTILFNIHLPTCTCIETLMCQIDL